MTTEAQRRVRELFDAALDQPPELRQRFLADACQGEPQLLQNVSRLLAAQEKSAGPLDTPVWQRRAPDVSAGEPGSFIGPYRILRRLVGGGMGDVYQVVRADEVFQRVCAIKVIRPELSGESLQQRFRQERQILARLDHPNIARIVDGGSTRDGLPYFVMDFVDGPSMMQFCTEHSLGIRPRLALFQQVCAAVQYLHRNEVIHGDLKPPNILVGSDGLVKLVDFGIASVLSASDGRAQDTALPLMTPGYASPEQMRGEPLSPASDIYSLGVVLYELLTGVRPFGAATRAKSEILRAIAANELLAPSVAVATSPDRVLAASPHSKQTLRGDLDSIVLRAMHRDPAYRYATVAQFSADLDQYRQSRPVVARQGSILYRTGKFVARQQRAVLAVTVIGVLLSTTVWEAADAKKHRDYSHQLEERVRQQESQAIRNANQRIAQLQHSAGANGRPDPRLLEEMRQSQLRDVNDLAQAYRTSLSEAVRLWPGMTPKRRELLDSADRYLRQAEPLVAQDPQGQAQLANAWLWLANLQGNPQTVNLHDHAGAQSSISEAESLLRKSSASSVTLIRQIETAANQIRNPAN